MNAKSLPVYVEPDICTRCGGKCCKGYPGLTSPEDWGAPHEDAMVARIVAAIETGKYAIDWWEGDPRDGMDELDHSDFVRPSVVGHEGEPLHAAWGGRCSLLTPTGCSLAHDDRPYGCRITKPDAGGKCKADKDKQEQVLAWVPFADVLLRVRDRVQQ